MGPRAHDAESRLHAFGGQDVENLAGKPVSDPASKVNAMSRPAVVPRLTISARGGDVAASAGSRGVPATTRASVATTTLTAALR